MEKSVDYIVLVEKAQLGNKECLNRLAVAVRERLYSYVYRYTLADDLTNDIVQESILKMLEAIGELREVEKFWPWLYKIALNKIHLYHRNEGHHRGPAEPDMNQTQKHKESQEVIAGVVYQEFRETVFAAMRELKAEHRSIINMRCYDQMQYSEIAKAIGRSEFAAQKLFFRAKKSLKKKLARHGLGKGSLLLALVLFGRLTAPSKAAAGSISVTGATVKVGAAASVAAAAASKTAIITLATAGVLAGSAIVATSGPEGSAAASVEKATESSYVLPQEVQGYEGSQEYWYYYPSKSSETVMMRVKRAESQYLQNAEANYYFDRGEKTVYIENHRTWQKDLSVWRLATDSFKLTEFLAQVDGGKRWTEDIYRGQSGLLLVVKQAGEGTSDQLQITHHYNVLGEDYFKYDWPANVEVIDNRDGMHRRGWTYFRIKGKVNGQMVDGTGRIAFVYKASLENRPWLRLRVGGKQLIDAGGGRLFKGLGRSWMGLHTIDTVRRDAAEKEIPFETHLISEGTKAEVKLTTGETNLKYIIDMDKDIVERIIYSGEKQGELVFTYLQYIDDIGREFSEPRRSGGLPAKEAGIMWLIREMNNRE